VDGLLQRKAWRSFLMPSALAAALAVGLQAALHFHLAPRFTLYAPGMEALALTFAPIAVGAGVAVAAAALLRDGRWALGGLAAGMVGTLLCCVLILSPAIEPYRPIYRLAMQARSLAAPGVKVGLHGRGKYEMTYYADMPLWHLPQAEDAYQMLQFPGHVLVVMPARVAAAAPKNIPVYVIARSADGVLVANWPATADAAPGAILGSSERQLLPNWLSPRTP
jgi:hypothetical protein